MGFKFPELRVRIPLPVPNKKGRAMRFSYKMCILVLKRDWRDDCPCFLEHDEVEIYAPTVVGLYEKAAKYKAKILGMPRQNIPDVNYQFHFGDIFSVKVDIHQKFSDERLLHTESWYEYVSACNKEAEILRQEKEDRKKSIEDNERRKLRMLLRKYPDEIDHD